jgi:hypothetical protein
LATLEGSEVWASERSAESLAIARQYLAGGGPFSQRSAQLELVSRFMTDFYVLVADWAAWAQARVAAWPDDPRAARADQRVVAETLRRAEAAAGRRVSASE